MNTIVERIRTERPSPPPPAGRRFTHAEDRTLITLWRSNRDIRAIISEIRALAAFWRRPFGEVCQRIERLIGPIAVAAGEMTTMERALFVLGGRAEENRSAAGGFVLDGVRATCADVIEAANRVLLLLCQPAIAWPGVGGGS